MRIVHCFRSPIGGLFRHVLDLAAEQSRMGHDVGILADNLAEDQLTAMHFERVNDLMSLGVTRTPMGRQPGVGDLIATKTVFKNTRHLDLDVLHGHGAKGGLYARLAARALRSTGQRVRAFYTPHGGSLHFDPASLEGKLYLNVERQLERFTAGLIFESGFACNAYIARVGTPTTAYRVIHNGLGPDDFSPITSRANASDLLFIGMLRDLKGVEVLLNAIAELRQERPITATIVGSGPDSDKFKQQCARLQLNDCVTFTGELPVKEAFSLGRLKVIPSLKDSFPYIVLETAAAGIPMVATSVGGIPEMVLGTDTELIEAGSVTALTSAIRSALVDPEAASERTARLRAHVQKTFTISAMTSSVLDFYTTAAP
jgi:glycosyltransferase involved in cell wall biosynthesis